jgi:fermentation-respiration switch protein FrsA (DUF1100 family)
MTARRAILVGLAYSCAAAATSWLTDSVGLWLIVAVGFIAVLDGSLLGVLHRKDRWRLAKFVVAAGVTAAALLVVGRGSIAALEAATVGMLLGLALAAFDLLGALISRVPWCAATLAGRRGTALRACAALAVLASVAFLAPVVTTLHLLRRESRLRPDHVGLAFEEVSFHADDGTNLRGWYVPAENPRGVVVYCHGHGSNRGQALGLLRTLLELNLDVLAFDFRGHGASDGHTATFGHREVADVLAAHRYAATRLPGRPVFLVGVSYGAAVSLQALPRLPGVRAAWLEAPFARFSSVADHKLAPIPRPLRRPMMATYFWLAWLDAGLSPGDINPIDCLDECRIPIAFVHGRRDDLIPFGEGEALFAAYEGPKHKFWVDNGNHFNLLQVAGDEYLRELRRFFEQQLAAESSSADSAAPLTGLDR